MFLHLSFMFVLSLQEAFRSNCRALGFMTAIIYDSWKKQGASRARCQVVIMCTDAIDSRLRG